MVSLQDTPARKILLTGGTGQVGSELLRFLGHLGEVTAPGSSDLDLTQPERIREAVRDIRPHLIVNAAAYTAVNRAEEERDLAMALNGSAPKILAEEARALKAAMVHYSTDYVFDGSKDGPYLETDEINPINVYGITKASGDAAVQKASIPHLHPCRRRLGQSAGRCLPLHPRVRPYDATGVRQRCEADLLAHRSRY